MSGGAIAGSIVVGDTIVGVGGGIDGLVVVGTWNPRRQEGNPTKSESVNQMIKKVKCKEGKSERRNAEERGKKGEGNMFRSEVKGEGKQEKARVE